MSAPPRGRPTLAVLLDNMFEGYEAQLWNHLSEVAQAEDVNLLCFLAGPARGQRLQRVVFDLPGRETVDAIIGLFGTLNMGRDAVPPPGSEKAGWNVNAPGCFSDGEVQAFLRRYDGLPVVSIGKRIAGVPTVLVDNALGMEQAVSHLVEVHRRRRIAFICGPEGNEESEARLRGYRSALERHGLPFDPALLCPGDFTMHAGPPAIRALLDERRVELDAVMGANDLMASAAMQELRRRGVRVPEDVAVAGFDDHPSAISATPALTTVGQPLRDIATAAVRQALTLIHGGAVADSTVLPTRPIHRRSCGCMGTAEHGWELPALPEGLQVGPRPAWSAAIARALEAADPWLGALSDPGCAAALVEALLAELEGARAGFLAQLDAAVSAGLAAGVPPLRWRRLLLGAFDAVRRRAEPDGQRLLALLSRSVALLGERAEHLRSLRSQDLAFEAFILQQIFRVTGVEAHDFTQALESQLPNLGVKSFYLARIVDPSALIATLDYHYALDDVVALDAAPGPYPARRIVPGRFTDRTRWTFVVMPLHFGAEVTGFAVCGGGSMSGSGYEALANQLGRAYKASTLVKEARRYAAELELRVEERARQLREAQQQLVEIAHEAGMAEIAVGALHNVGNLLNSISVSAEAASAAASGDRTVKGLTRLVALLQEHRSDLAAFFATDPRAALVPEYTQELLRTLEGDRDRVRAETAGLQAHVALVRDTIATLQELARGQDNLLVERMELAVLVEAALKLQEGNLARHHVQVVRRLEAAPSVLVQRFKLIHVLVNLIRNAVDAMQRAPEGQRLLTVAVAAGAGAGAIVRITDTGEGIPADRLGRLFTLGFTTRSEGRGFGLHACANALHQMGGRIVAESEGPGRGARFTLEFPG